MLKSWEVDMRTYTAKEAADLTGHSERTIRRRIERGQLRAKKNDASNEWEIQDTDLPMRKPDPFDELRRELAGELRQLEQRIEELEKRQQYVMSLPPAPDITTSRWQAPADRVPITHEGLRTYADAGRWLAHHSDMSEKTPKTWPKWQQVVPLEPRALLRDAMRRKQESGYRALWSLHQCGDPRCVCVEELG